MEVGGGRENVCLGKIWNDEICFCAGIVTWSGRAYGWNNELHALRMRRHLRAARDVEQVPACEVLSGFTPTLFTSTVERLMWPAVQTKGYVLAQRRWGCFWF